MDFDRIGVIFDLGGIDRAWRAHAIRGDGVRTDDEEGALLESMAGAGHSPSERLAATRNR